MKFSQPGRRPVILFRAAFEGDCETCGEPTGELIGYLPGDDRASCEDCVEEHNEEVEK